MGASDGEDLARGFRRFQIGEYRSHQTKTNAGNKVDRDRDEPGAFFLMANLCHGDGYDRHPYHNPGEREVTSLLRIEMDGLTIKLLGFIIKPLVAYSLKEENQGLKQYCESSLQ